MTALTGARWAAGLSNLLRNSDPLEDGWLFKVKLTNADELNGLMTQDAYDKYLEGLD